MDRRQMGFPERSELMRSVRGFSLFLAALVVGCGTAPSSAPAPLPQKQADAHTDMPAHTPKTDKAGAPAAAPAKVVIDNFAFEPRELTVSAGTEVTWVNHDDVPHTATSTAKPKAFDSGTLDTDQTYSHVFTAAGEYEYFCAVHPKMTGKVVVK
jgi:plastocyanin